MTDKKEEKAKATTETVVEEKKPEDKFFGKLFPVILILCRAQKEPRPP